MTDTKYRIVFEKLDEAARDEAQQGGTADIEASYKEIEEIAELRRIVFELVNPTPSSYTTT